MLKKNWYAYIIFISIRFTMYLCILKHNEDMIHSFNHGLLRSSMCNFTVCVTSVYNQDA